MRRSDDRPRRKRRGKIRNLSGAGDEDGFILGMHAGTAYVQRPVMGIGTHDELIAWRSGFLVDYSDE